MTNVHNCIYMKILTVYGIHEGQENELSYPILFITIVPIVDSSQIQSVRSTRITVTIILEVAWS